MSPLRNIMRFCIRILKVYTEKNKMFDLFNLKVDNGCTKMFCFDSNINNLVKLTQFINNK